MGMEYRSFPDEVAQIKEEFLRYRGPVFRDPGVSLRDKVAIMLLSMGVGPFEWAWHVYSASTHRHGNA